jgi:DNA primase
MELPDIKAQLTISQVLQHYALQPDKNNRLLCPFHPDTNPSLQIYPATNTYCCFSSNCTAGTGDAIQFIQLKENCNKHEALLKAATLLNGHAVAATVPAAKLLIETASLEKIAVITKAFNPHCSYWGKRLAIPALFKFLISGGGTTDFFLVKG